MDDEKRSNSNTSNSSISSSRRQSLKYLAASTLGGSVAVGLEHILDDEDEGRPDNNPSVNRYNIPSEYDAYVFERNAGYESLSSNGNTIHSGNDGWTVLENTIDDVPNGGSIYVIGEYTGTSSIRIRKPIQMNGHEAIITHEEPGDFVFRFEGEERRQTALAEAAVTGDNTVILDDPEGIQKGDMVLLEEEEGENVLGRDQPPGEPHSILGVDSNVIKFEDSIIWRNGYPSGTLAYIVRPIEVHMTGFNLVSPAMDENYLGIAAQQCRDSTFRKLRLDKFGNRGIVLEACANSRVRDCTVLQSSDIEAANGYGIQVWSGCHDIIVEGCTAKECRHPLSVTPGGDREVASRSIMFRDCYVTSNGSAAINCHGGAAHDVRIEGCVVHTWNEAGVRTGAQETNISSCEFRMNRNNAIDTRNDGQEMILTVTDSDIFGAGAAVHLDRESEYDFAPLWKLVHIEGVRTYGCNRFFELENGNIDRLRSLMIRGCHWDQIGEEGLRIRNRIDGGIIEGNDFGAAPNGSHIHARDETSTDVNNLHIVGNRFRQPEGTDTFIRLSHCENCVVSDNKFESGTDVDIYEDETGSTANLVKENAYFAPGPSAEPFVISPGSFAENNHVYDTEAQAWL